MIFAMGFELTVSMSRTHMHRFLCVISGDFMGFRVQKRCFPVLLLTLFPRSPSL